MKYLCFYELRGYLSADDAYNLTEPKVSKAEENFIKQVKKLPEDGEPKETEPE